MRSAKWKWSRRTCTQLAVALLALGGAVPANAAEDTTAVGGSTTANSGGSRYFAPPRILCLQCQARCGGSATASRSRALVVREKGLLRIRGRNLQEVRNVIFLGGPGRGDNLGVAPERATPASLEVKVPVGAA